MRHGALPPAAHHPSWWASERVGVEHAETEVVAGIGDRLALVERLAGEEQRRHESGPGPDVQRDPRVDQWQEGIEALILVASTSARGEDRRLSVAAQVEV